MIIQYFSLSAKRRIYSLIISLLQQIYALYAGHIDAGRSAYRCWRQDIYAVDTGYICAVNASY